ncbi:PepSY domain-containing protein [Streptomyces sp. NEAU-W12]|uniref:PepSY domain-containing protein n=1 Tax=Streptomyces sp. NEAU-W12 TaxID=2994668 RepID=UPI00224AE789|nr:PepSY domain-containing protein [Streptomyces sp. NEAU-W12]MCX2924221.1 PepSY domain-containing protein [Streptomyces sp. NEAU-W12]
MKRNIVIAAVTAAALVGGGTATAIAVSGDDEPTATSRAETRGSDDDRDDDDRDDRRDGTDTDDDRDGLDDGSRTLSADVTADEAVAAALKHRPGTAVSVELDDDDDDDHRGRAAWEVDILGGGDTWHSVWIDPSSGRVLGSERDNGDDDDTAEARAALKGTSVTAGEAARAAAAKGTVTSVDLDDDDTEGWEVGTAAGGDDREWLVGLNSGRVTADDDSDDRGDDRDDRDDRDDDGNEDRDDR